ncbi:MAG: CHAD domain-containing protein, partial [Arenicellales bacterium]
MAYRLKHSKAVAAEIERVVVEQIDRATAGIDNAGVDPDTTIHQVRKRCKKIRAVLRLARGSLDKDGVYEVENAFFRDLAAELSDLRDAVVLIETHDELAGDIENPDVLIECAAVRGRLTTRRLEMA